MLVTGDQQLIKQINRMALVRHLCHEPELSRAALAEVVGLTKSTVSLLVRELIDEGWLSESELISTGVSGRRATPLHIDATRLALLGADLGVNQARIVATNLLGKVLDVREIVYDDASDPSSCIKLMAKALLRMATRMASKQHKRSILGVGIGLHGGVDDTKGVLHFAPHLGWRDVDVSAKMRDHFVGSTLAGLPLFMQNDADVSALAEFEFTGHANDDPLVYLNIGHGVGAGIIMKDRLLTGLRGFAGEVGHTILQADGPLCSCGRRGCADALIGLGALLGAAGSASSKRRRECLEILFQKVEAGDAATSAAVAAAGRHLGILLNNLWVAFDPMCIVLGGSAMRLGSVFTNPARRVLNEYAQAALLLPPEIRASRFGEEAVAVGAAAMVRYRLTRPFDMHT